MLAQVSYLKAISSSYQPVHALQPPTTRLLCHGARHKSTSRDLLEGWAAAALRPIATLLQPLQTVHWSGSHPSGRDLEAALVAATAATSDAVAARRQLLQGVPPPKPANPAIRAPAAVAAPAGAATGSKGPVGVHALNRFCWDTATRPHAAEAVELAAHAALRPGTDMTPEDVAARKAAAARAAEAAVAHALLLSTLPVWFAPGETGSCAGAVQASAELLPMPAYGLSIDLDAVQADEHQREGVLESLPELAAHCVQQLLAVQQAGPYVLVGCGVFSCMLASAMASVLEHQMQQQQVVLVQLDGPPALPANYEVPDPVLYGLYQVLRDAGRLPGAAAGTSSFVPISFAGFAAEMSAGVQAALAAMGHEQLSRHSSFSSISTAGGMSAQAGASSAMLLASVPEDRVAAVEAAVLQVASGLLRMQLDPSAPPAAGGVGPEATMSAAVNRMLRVCRLVRRLSGAYAPEFVYNVPAVLLLTEDAPGQAFLEVARERWVWHRTPCDCLWICLHAPHTEVACGHEHAANKTHNSPGKLLLTPWFCLCCSACARSCGGELSLVPLAGLLHGQVLSGAAEQQVVVVALVEGHMEMLQMV